VDFSLKVLIITMADTFVDMNHEYDNDLVNVLEALLLQAIKPPASADHL
jgi:hypothetical protein